MHHTKLFVYGSLRRAGPRHRRIESAVRWVGPARFRGRLYDLGRYPGATPSSDPADEVCGDLFRVIAPDPDAFLARLDRWEGREYRRERVEVRTPEPGLVRAWTYLYIFPPKGLRVIASGDFLRDLAAGGAAKRF